MKIPKANSLHQQPLTNIFIAVIRRNLFPSCEIDALGIQDNFQQSTPGIRRLHQSILVEDCLAQPPYLMYLNKEIWKKNIRRFQWQTTGKLNKQAPPWIAILGRNRSWVSCRRNEPLLIRFQGSSGLNLFKGNESLPIHCPWKQIRNGLKVNDLWKVKVVCKGQNSVDRIQVPFLKWWLLGESMHTGKREKACLNLSLCRH